MLNFLFNKDNILQQSRYPWIDYARGICILLVVYRHVYEALTIVGAGSDSYSLLRYLNVMLFSFRMPLFFIISGVFFSGSFARKGLKSYVSNRVQTILYPLLVWGSLQVSLQLLFAGSVNANREVEDYLNLLIEPRRIEQFWYLNALFFVGCLYALLRTVFNIQAKAQVIAGLIFFTMAAFVYHMEWNIGFLIDVLFFYIFFAFGDLIAPYVLNQDVVNKWSRFTSILWMLPVFALAQYVFSDISITMKDDYYVHHHLSFLYLLIALMGGIFVIAVSFWLQKIGRLRFLRVIGYHSLYIYVMHLMLAAGVRVFFVKVLHYESVIPVMLVCILVGVTVPMIVYNLCARWGLWWLFSLKKDPIRRNPQYHGK